MTIQHHPSDEALIACANGSLSMALSLVVGAHVDVCSECAETLSLAETMGGAFLEALPPVEMRPDALDKALLQLDTQNAEAEHAKADLSLPPTLQTMPIGPRRWLAPGIWVSPILKDRASGTRLYMLGAAAGKSLPRHSHQGREMTQVLTGSFSDGDTRYGAGDFLEAGSDHEHRPVVGADEECVCVIASKGVPRGVIGLLMRAVT